MLVERWNAFERLRDIVANTLGVERDRIDPEASLLDDLQVDSLDRAQLFLALETSYGIRIEDEDVHGIYTIADLWEHVEALGRR